MGQFLSQNIEKLNQTLEWKFDSVNLYGKLFYKNRLFHQVRKSCEHQVSVYGLKSHCDRV